MFKDIKENMNNEELIILKNNLIEMIAEKYQPTDPKSSKNHKE